MLQNGIEAARIKLIMKSYTDLEQSKILAKILPLESADMCYSNDGTAIKIDANPYTVRYSMWKNCVVEIIPCWSLAALLSVIPKHINEFNVLRIDISTNDFAIWYDEIGFGVNNDLPDVTKESAVDACVKMIVKLHELNLL